MSHHRAVLTFVVGSLLGKKSIQHKVLTVLRWLTLLPMLFMLCVSGIFCVASIATGAIYSGCGPVDYVGRYTVPLVIALPFLIASICILPSLFLEQRPRSVSHQGSALSLFGSRDTYFFRRLTQIALGAILVLYFILQGVAYAQADPLYTFHPTGCVAENPTEVTPLIAYMQQAHIRYVWASSWVGNRITFLTDGAIIATDMPGRIPANSQIVLHQDRPSIYLLVHHTDSHPAFLQMLDAQHVIPTCNQTDHLGLAPNQMHHACTARNHHEVLKPS